MTRSLSIHDFNTFVAERRRQAMRNNLTFKTYMAARYLGTPSNAQNTEIWCLASPDNKYAILLSAEEGADYHISVHSQARIVFAAKADFREHDNAELGSACIEMGFFYRPDWITHYVPGEWEQWLNGLIGAYWDAFFRSLQQGVNSLPKLYAIELEKNWGYSPQEAA